VGRGYHTREVETFGSPLLDQPANRELFEEQVDIIFEAFNKESFSHKGSYYTIPPEVPYRGYDLKEITLVPRPVNRPVECWQPIQSATPRGLDFMAKHGIKGIIGGGSSEGGAMDRAVQGLREAYSRTGVETEPGENLAIGFHFHIAETQEQAMKEVGQFYEENLKMFGPLRLVKALSDEQIEAMSNPETALKAGLPTIEDAVAAGGVLAGPAELIIEQLKALEQKYPGLNRISVSHPVGTPKSVMIEQLERFSEQVMPAFKGSVPELVPGDW
jgi:alkanesulfonate monooxygenase SsuD/methylene tetrahydromethanopterin reductase-like flavin-dependent oxidoreductase (luciferase family)